MNDDKNPNLERAICKTCRGQRLIPILGILGKPISWLYLRKKYRSAEWQNSRTEFTLYQNEFGLFPGYQLDVWLVHKYELGRARHIRLGRFFHYNTKYEAAFALYKRHGIRIMEELNNDKSN